MVSFKALLTSNTDSTLSIPEEICTGLMFIRILKEQKISRPTLEKIEDHRMGATALLRNKLKPCGLYIVDDIKVNDFTIGPILDPE